MGNKQTRYNRSISASQKMNKHHCTNTFGRQAGIFNGIMFSFNVGKPTDKLSLDVLLPKRKLHSLRRSNLTCVRLFIKYFCKLVVLSVSVRADF